MDGITQPPGTLFLVVGPSGAGKDTVIVKAKQQLAADSDPRFHFATRYVTRSAEDCAELEVAKSSAALLALSEQAGLALSWEAHGLSYAVGTEITAQLAAGKCVVANVSRMALQTARMKYRKVKVLNVTASEETLLARLRARGREDEEAIAKRVAAAAENVPGDDVVGIDNDGALEDSVEALLQALYAEAPELPSESESESESESDEEAAKGGAEAEAEAEAETEAEEAAAAPVEA